MTPTQTDVLIIGAGQAGLAAAARLRHTAYTLAIVDADARIGESWRKRYDSLVLFTPRWHNGLPGLPLAGDPEGFPTRDEFADYLEMYARTLGLPITHNTRITRLEQDGDGLFTAASPDRVWRARAVVIATGSFQRPHVPALAARLAPDVVQVTASAYRSPASLPPGRVLVVGDGAYGRDIAKDLARGRGHTVMLAAGRARMLFPQFVLGRSAWWWMRVSGFMRIPVASRAGRFLRSLDAFPDRETSLHALRRMGVDVLSGAADADGRTVHFRHGETRTVDAVVWAAGYRDDSGWVHIAAATDADGQFTNSRTVSPVPGLFFLGRPWPKPRGSALIADACWDSAALSDAVTAYLAETVPAAARLEKMPDVPFR
jgi:putative flavoprotein involved in K+ transport